MHRNSRVSCFAEYIAWICSKEEKHIYTEYMKQTGVVAVPRHMITERFLLYTVLKYYRTQHCYLKHGYVCV